MTYLLAFIEGLLSICSPCIFPILPLVISNSFISNTKRALGISLGFTLFFMIIMFGFTACKFSISLHTIHFVSNLLLLLMCLFLVSPTLNDCLVVGMEKVIHPSYLSSFKENSSFVNGVLFGGLLGLTWTPCIGALLGVAMTQALQQVHLAQSFGIMLCFAIGANIPLFIIGCLGKTALSKIKFLYKEQYIFRVILALCIVGYVWL